MFFVKREENLSTSASIQRVYVNIECYENHSNTWSGAWRGAHLLSPVVVIIMIVIRVAHFAK